MKHLSKVLLLVLLMSTACSNLYKVTYSDSRKKPSTQKKVKGIPFYTQKPVLRQTTSYLDQWYQVTLESVPLKPDEKASTLFSGSIQSAANNVSVLNEIEQKVVSFNLAGYLRPDSERNQDIEGLTEQLAGLTKHITSEQGGDVTPKVYANSWKEEVVIDYERTYYINGRMPWFGNASFSQELNANGSLSKASGTADSQLSEFIASNTPLDSFLTSIVFPSSEEIEEEELKALGFNKAGSADLKLKLTILPKGKLYTFTAIRCDCGRCDDCCNNGECGLDIAKAPRTMEKIAFDLDKGNYTESDWPPKAAAAPKKDDRPKIDVSGTVVLPKKD